MGALVVEKHRSSPSIDQLREIVDTIAGTRPGVTTRTSCWTFSARNCGAPAKTLTASSLRTPSTRSHATCWKVLPPHANNEVCPSCGEADAICYIGSRVATLLSVGLSNLFGMPSLDQHEKKTLVFEDAVQDAAHRAGFVQSRARAFGIRTLMRRVVGDDAVSVAELPQRLVARADAMEDPFRARFELLPPEIAETPKFTAFWSKDADGNARRAATTAVLNRLHLDAALEFGSAPTYRARSCLPARSRPRWTWTMLCCSRSRGWR